jgi:hypothetical protein
MARRKFFFPGKTVQEQKKLLEAALAEVQEEILSGKVNTEFGGADTNFKAVIDSKLSPERRRNMILADLSILDPATYPTDDVTPVRVTSARFVDP